MFFSIFSIAYPLLSYFYSDKIVLFLTNAKEADPIKDVYLVNVGEGLALAAGFKKPPKFYIIEDPSPNAFATGKDPDHGVIAVTRGLLNLTNRQELEGVIAHEMSHIKNYDTRFMTLVVVMVGLIGFLSNFVLRYSFFTKSNYSQSDRRSQKGAGIIFILVILAATLSPIISRLIALAISRKREYLADASAVQLTRNPEGLASALEKIKNSKPSSIDYGPAKALFFSNPNPSIMEKFSNLFSTHPPIDERIKILRSM
ncbi:MAG: M48 family metallopeptidase [Candidatus Omnitrophica bacterium]|nr:M48 family metallopeptidase [Candidatus Omnitrophota bacterium]